MPPTRMSWMSHDQHGWSTGHARSLLRQCLRDELLRQDGGFASGKHPAYDVPAVQDENDVRDGVRPPLRAEQLRDVTRPQLLRLGGKQFGVGEGGQCSWCRRPGAHCWQPAIGTWRSQPRPPSVYEPLRVEVKTRPGRDCPSLWHDKGIRASPAQSPRWTQMCHVSIGPLQRCCGQGAQRDPTTTSKGFVPRRVGAGIPVDFSPPRAGS